jgi:hypothetical protein
MFALIALSISTLLSASPSAQTVNPIPQALAYVDRQCPNGHQMHEVRDVSTLAASTGYRRIENDADERLLGLLRICVKQASDGQTREMAQVFIESDNTIEERACSFLYEQDDNIRTASTYYRCLEDFTRQRLHTLRQHHRKTAFPTVSLLTQAYIEIEREHLHHIWGWIRQPF